MSGYCPDCGNTQCLCKEVADDEARAESSFAAQAGSATGYKSVCELAADNPNLAEYLAQLERTVQDINRIDEWARKIWGSVCLLGPEDQDRLALIIDACEQWRQSPNTSASRSAKPLSLHRLARATG